MSGLVPFMEAIQAQTFDGPNRVQGERYTLLGDGIFRHLARHDGTCLASYHIAAPGIDLPQWQVNENKLYRSIREHIEHSYGGIETTFALCALKSNFKLRSSNSIVIECLNLSFFLYNCYSCENGNSSSCRFGCIPPTLDEYLSLIN